MSQNVELNKVKEKIRKLLNMQVEKGCSEAEANAAMTRVGNLLEQYNLTLNEVDVASENCIQKIVNTGTKKSAQYGSVAMGIAKFCGVRTWRSKTSEQVRYVFFGFESDCEMAEYLFNVIKSALITETAKFKQTSSYINAMLHRKSLSTSFQNGFVNRIYYRLVEMSAETEQVRAERVSNSTALVMVAKSEKVEAEFGKLGMRLRKLHSSQRSTSGSAYGAGSNAGSSVNLSRPVGSNKATLRIGN